MSKMVIIEGNSNDKDNVRNYMVKGEKGDKGFTPTITATKEANITTIEITNEESTETTEIYDGVDLTGGVPTNGILAFDGTTIPNGYEETNIVDLIYPIGSIYMSVNNTNPSSLFGGTWTSWGAGKVPVGVDTNDTDFNTVEKTGGEKTHTLTINEMPSHNHAVSLDGNEISDLGAVWSSWNTPPTRRNYTGSDLAQYTGGGQSHNNLQPYITCYMWKRTA